jgi:hypothetical protein
MATEEERLQQARDEELRERAVAFARDFRKEGAKELIAEAKIIYKYLKNG